MVLVPPMHSLLRIVCFLCFIIGHSQHKIFYKIPDSLKKADINYLQNAFKKNNSKPEKQSIYANVYLIKAKEEKNAFNIFSGFEMLYGHLNKQAREIYADSVIYYAAQLEDKKYVSRGYFNKGVINYEIGNLKAALNAYTKAEHYAKISEEKNIINNIKIKIAWIKRDIGEYADALILSKEYTSNLKEKAADGNDTDRLFYIKSLYLLSDLYNRNKKLDTAASIIDEGIKESLKYNMENAYNYLVFSSGINQYLKGNYNSAHDSLLKASVFFEEKKLLQELTVGYLYLAKTKQQQNKYKEAITYITKVDSLQLITSYTFPEIREAYAYVITYYKSKKDIEKQLYYNERLINVDSILFNKHKYLIQEIGRKYETPQLVSEKEVIINALEEKGGKLSKRIITLLLIVVGLLLSIAIINRRRKLLKQRFNTLMKEVEIKKNKAEPSGITKIKKEIGLSKETIDDILKKIKQFEEKERYTNNKITLNNMSKSLKTNSAYLSRVINNVKEKNFAHYLSDLRIDYVINRLKKDKRFRLYSIKAIAEESGFNSPEVFSKAFYKRTQLYPSYFIKQLNKNYD